MWREPHGPTLFTGKSISNALNRMVPLSQACGARAPMRYTHPKRAPGCYSPLDKHACLSDKEFRVRADTPYVKIVAISVT